MAKKKKATQIVFLLDQTGSMESCKKDTVGGFNVFLEEQKKEKNDLRFTLTLFNSAEIEKRHVKKNIKDVEPLSEKNYIPSNLTPLWDAIGNTIQDFPEEEKVMFVILTDGYENYSKEFKADAVKLMIAEKEKRRNSRPMP